MKETLCLLFFAFLLSFFSSFSHGEGFTPGAGGVETVNGGDSVGDCVRGNGSYATTEREVSFFSAIHVDGPVDAFILAGQKTPKLEVSGDNNLHSFLITEVRGKTLFLSQRGAVCTTTKGLTVTVFTGAPDSLFAGGSSTVTLSGLKNKEFQIHIEGSADLSARGTTENLTVQARGATDVNLGKLTASNVIISVTGSSDVEIFASDSLQAHVEDAGDLVYHGNPERVTGTVSGAGDMEKSL